MSQFLHDNVDYKADTKVIAIPRFFSELTCPGFYVSAVQVFENTAGKGEIARNVFYPSAELSAIHIKLKNCRLRTLTVWKSIKFVIWEIVNHLV